MEKKNNKWIVTVIVSVAVIILVVILTILMVNSSSPKKSIEGLLTNLKSGEFEKAQEFVIGDDALLSSAQDLSVEIQKLLFDKLSWKINNILKDGNEAIIEIEITNKDLKSITKQILKDAFANEAMSKEQIENALTEALKGDNIQTTTISAKLKAIKEDKWKIEANEELDVALIPSLENVIQSIKAMDILNNLNK